MGGLDVVVLADGQVGALADRSVCGLYEVLPKMPGGDVGEGSQDHVNLDRHGAAARGVEAQAATRRAEEAERGQSATAERLADLRAAGVRLAVVTSKAEPTARRIVEHFGLARFFRTLYGSELDGTRTNKVELIAHLLEREGFAPSDAYMVGDRKHDVIGARANGVNPIAVLWGYGTREELEALVRGLSRVREIFG